MAKIFAITNQKGGVGKTTTSVNLAASLAATKRRVLLVDIDPQGNATMGSGIDKRALRRSTFDLLMNDAPVSEVAMPLPAVGYDLVPANSDLTGAEVGLLEELGRELKLRVALSAVVEDYDYILIDCPPSLNMLTVNALVAADSVIIPIQCEYYALEGLSALVETIEKIRKVLNPKLKIEGLLRTMYDPRNNLATQVSAQLLKYFGDKVYTTVIPRNVRLAEAPSHGLPVILYDRQSSGSLAYLALAGEMLRKDNNYERLELTAAAVGKDRAPAPRFGERTMSSANKRGLGRGLDALLGIGPETATPKAEAAAADHALRSMPVDLIQRGRYQPRSDFEPESLQELADSIRAQGIVQPIVVRRLPGQERYEIIAGERRWRAAQIAGLHEVPVLVRDVDDRTAMSVALIENIQRKDLNAIEEATALHRLVNEFGLTHEKVAEAVGRSRAAVSNLLRLLELAEPVRHMVEKRELEMGHARALLALPLEQQPAAARHVVARSMSVRQAEQYVKGLLAPRSRAAGGARRVDPDVQRLQRELGERLGARVELTHGRKGAGTVTIHYHSLEELDGILSHIR